jgi:hypothetical protein
MVEEMACFHTWPLADRGTWEFPMSTNLAFLEYKFLEKKKLNKKYRPN